MNIEKKYRFREQNNRTLWDSALIKQKDTLSRVFSKMVPLAANDSSQILICSLPSSAAKAFHASAKSVRTCLPPQVRP